MLKNKDFGSLSIGTIVKVNSINKMVMIFGKNIVHLEQNKQYDYLGCIYPEGYIGDHANIFFNENSIEKIIIID